MKFLTIISFLLITSSLFGQNTIRFSNFNFTKSIYNPATLADEAPVTADLVYRTQWLGLEGAPSTFGFNGAYEINDLMAVGLNFYNDRIGLNQTNSISAMYSYRLIFDDRNYLGFGLGVGVDNISWNLNEASTIQANDPVFSMGYSKWAFNSSFGLYYRNPKFYAGISIPQLFQNTLFGADKGLKLIRFHYHALAGYYFQISDRFTFHPSAQIKYTWNAPIQGDIILRGIFSDLGFSAGYRSENTIVAGLDYTFINRLRIAYSANYDLEPIARSKGWSHEIYLGIGLPYYNSRVGMDGRIYVNRKGGYKGNYRRSAKRKQVRRNN
jgi:type IX secretion system PorP/SprF family membrane protein